ncbi:DUF523 domain-containing protein [Colwellia demingiae]|uniref:DUF523 domain-containing protein n=1 Tax=Colwellia demingiae TaxID=89401 RepID=A0A5C6QBQ3_9GAMM|nr:DUF523 domain-containing protein [Colwellia demingiae]TWX66376.1 DUF523 domain-containing protein [Colwellia demingiae]
MKVSEQPIKKILISSCFLGERVRYNGVVKPLVNKLLEQWKKQGRLIAICPEVISGLPVPRPPAEIDPNTKKVITIESIDVTEQFDKGAKLALRLCRQHNIQVALLKESSPSCGSNTIYDGTFRQQKIIGEGVTTKLLRGHGIKVFCEDSIEELAAQIEN